MVFTTFISLSFKSIRKGYRVHPYNYNNNIKYNNIKQIMEATRRKLKDKRAPALFGIG